jgi:hypothetical protein
MEQVTESQAVSILKSQVGAAILQAAVSHAAPLFWMLPAEDKQAVKPGGSIFFLRPEPVKRVSFAVTANRVFQAYLKAKKSFAAVECQIGNIPFRLEERLIDTDEELDIASFQVSLDEIWKLGKVALTHWPPRVPELGKGVLFVGFPGLEGHTLISGEASFGTYAALGTATSVDERHVTGRFEREYWVSRPSFALPSNGYDSSGLSGAPLYTVVEQSGFFLLALGGIIHSANTNSKIFTASRADKILPEGRLQK